MTHFLNLVKYGCILWVIATVGTGWFDMQTSHRYPSHAVYELASLAGIIAVSYVVIRYSICSIANLWRKIKWRR